MCPEYFVTYVSGSTSVCYSTGPVPVFLLGVRGKCGEWWTMEKDGMIELTSEDASNPLWA
jgi:hypothetical protein